MRGADKPRNSKATKCLAKEKQCYAGAMTSIVSRRNCKDENGCAAEMNGGAKRGVAVEWQGKAAQRRGGARRGRAAE